MPVITQVEIEFSLANYNLHHSRDLLLMSRIYYKIELSGSDGPLTNMFCIQRHFVWFNFFHLEYCKSICLCV